MGRAQAISIVLVTCAIGVFVSWDIAREADASRFPLGSLLLLVAITTLSTPADFASFRRVNTLAWTILPVVVWFFLYGQVHPVAQQISERATPELLQRYGAISIRFLVFLFLWIISFPDEGRLAMVPLKIRLLWRGVVILAACAVAVFEIPRVLAGLTHSVTARNGFLEFQKWLVAAGWFLCVLLIARKLFSLIVSRHASKHVRL